MNKSQENKIIKKALKILSKRINRGLIITNPDSIRNYLTVKLSGEEREIFGCVFLNNEHRVIGEPVELFAGNHNSASVYPREVVKMGLKLNASSIILFHNHPSGRADYSQADRNITNQLVDACGLVDIKILDHLIVGGVTISSFAEQGLL